ILAILIYNTGRFGLNRSVQNPTGEFNMTTLHFSGFPRVGAFRFFFKQKTAYEMDNFIRPV
ncbi:hypothetical protein, partial [Neisseria meningitidis]|uniref:hypothetical protein n=1 Tax=Neisseria meningitidis TaxID=487 RepID=UPI0021F21550